MIFLWNVLWLQGCVLLQYRVQFMVVALRVKLLPQGRGFSYYLYTGLFRDPLHYSHSSIKCYVCMNFAVTFCKCSCPFQPENKKACHFTVNST
jgi:hypothetical protein